mgnify:CR=1 FL=1
MRQTNLSRNKGGLRKPQVETEQGNKNKLGKKMKKGTG